MNDKPGKVDVDFNEALRRIAKMPKGLVVPHEKSDKVARKKAAPTKKAERG